jgi:hypothetical protein
VNEVARKARRASISEGSHSPGLVHNRRVMHDSFELIDRARRRLEERGLQCAIAGGVSDAAVEAAEQSVACTFPPSYRAFLRRFGALALPPAASTIHTFVGLRPDGSNVGSNDGAIDGSIDGLIDGSIDGSGDGAATDVVALTLKARQEHNLGDSLFIVAIGAQPNEWYCLDIGRIRADGECPVMLFDAGDKQLDQQFYDDFGSMMHEVMTFVLETIDHDESVEHADQAATDDSSSLGGIA